MTTPKPELEKCTESFAKCIALEFEDGRAAMCFVEDSYGMLQITTSEGDGCINTWSDDPSAAPYEFFEDFLVEQTPEHITTCLLGESAKLLDLPSTRDRLLCVVPELPEEVDSMIKDLDQNGVVALPYKGTSQIKIEEALGEPVSKWLMYRKTEIAEFLTDLVIPALIQKLKINEEPEHSEGERMRLS